MLMEEIELAYKRGSQEGGEARQCHAFSQIFGKLVSVCIRTADTEKCRPFSTLSQRDHVIAEHLTAIGTGSVSGWDRSCATIPSLSVLECDNVPYHNLSTAILKLMRITVDLPDDIARHADPGREALEALAIEGYRSGKLTHYQAAQLLGLTRFEFDGFLTDRQIYDHAYSVEDLDRDLADLEKLRARGLLAK